MNISDYFTYESKLKLLTNNKSIRAKKIGQEKSHYKFSIYKVTIGNLKKPENTLCFAGGIHGDEISGSLGIINFLSELKQKNFGHLKIIYLPVANPYGFHRKVRVNSSRINLNRHFTDKKLKNECKALYQSISKERVDLFCSFHEDDIQNKFYLYTFNKNKKQDKLINQIKKTASKYCPLLNKKIIYKNEVEKSVIYDLKDGSFEGRMNKDGVKISLCPEIPDSLPLNTRIKMVKDIIINIIEYYKKTDK